MILNNNSFFKEIRKFVKSIQTISLCRKYKVMYFDNKLVQKLLNKRIKELEK